MTDQPDTARRLSVQHTDALWDAITIPGPTEPTFTEQHQRVCKAVADILDEMTPAAVVPPEDRAAYRARIAAAVDAVFEQWRVGLGGRRPQDAVTDAVLAVLPAPVDRATVLRDFLWRLEQSAGDAAAEKFLDDNPELRRLAAEATPEPATDDEGDELVCVDMCGSCDACGMEPFGSPAEGWREAARFLRRTARDSSDRHGALHGARLIEDELRRRAEAAVVEAQPDDTQEAVPPPVGYSGKGRVFCVACPHPDDENVPLTVNDVDPWDLCPSCGRHVIDVARAKAEADRG